MAASMSRFVPFLQYPVDSGLTWHGKRIFGSHKTWRGLLFGIIFGILWFWLQQFLYRFDFFKDISLVDYSELNWTLGLALGLGAVLGDLFRSFFKRRLNIAPGMPWIPFDQIDYVAGAIIIASLVYFPGWDVSLAAIGLGFVLHILVNVFAYLIRLQKNKL